MNPKRIAVKIFSTAPEAGVDLAPFIPLFHRVIQQGSFEGLLVDVADYIHVPDGPGVILVGHDVDYGIDSVGGRTGLLTVRKRAGDVPLAELLQDTLRRALGAAKQIEEDPSSGIRFDFGQVEVQLLDRLAAGNDAAGFEAAKGGVESVAAQLYGGGATVSRVTEEDLRKPLSFCANANQAVEVKSLLDRLGAAPDAVAEVPGPQVPGQTAWDISVEQLKQLRDTRADFVLVDVREDHEVAICEIGGTQIPMGQLGARMSELDPGGHIVVHCHVGGRSAAAVNALRDAGYGNVWNLQGGIRAWIQRIDPDLQDY